MDSVIIAAIFLGISQIIGFYAFSVLLRRAIDAKQAEIEARAEAALHEWMDAQPEGKPSRFAEVLDASGAIIGSAAARSIMATLMAEKSHTARAANGLSDELQGATNPILGLLTGGKRGKGAAIARLAEIIGPMIQGGNGHGETSQTLTRKRRD